MNGRPTDDFFEHEPIDDVLGRTLRDLAPRHDDTDDVLDALEPRARRARRRHRVTRAASAAAALTLVAGLGALAASGEPDRGVPFAATTTTAGAPSTTTTVPGATTSSVAPVGGTTPQTTLTPTTESTAPVLPAEEQTFTSDGGSVQVRLAGGSLSLLGTDPAPGFTAEVVEQRPDRIEVRFASADGERDARIRVRVEDGRMVEEIDSSG